MREFTGRARLIFQKPLMGRAEGSSLSRPLVATGPIILLLMNFFLIYRNHYPYPYLGIAINVTYLLSFYPRF